MPTRGNPSAMLPAVIIILLVVVAGVVGLVFWNPLVKSSGSLGASITVTYANGQKQTINSPPVNLSPASVIGTGGVAVTGVEFDLALTVTYSGTYTSGSCTPTVSVYVDLNPTPAIGSLTNAFPGCSFVNNAAISNKQVFAAVLLQKDLSSIVPADGVFHNVCFNAGVGVTLTDASTSPPVTTIKSGSIPTYNSFSPTCVSLSNTAQTLSILSVTVAPTATIY